MLKKRVPFFWDEETPHSFEALKSSLMFTPMLNPPNYGKDFLLYLAAIESTISMALVQEDDVLQENAMYYLI
jgi:hypothetical protein